MSTSDNDQRSKSSGRPLRWIGGGAALVLAIGLLGWAVSASSAPDDGEINAAELYTVRKEPLVVSVNQPGQIESRNKVIIKSQIRSDMIIERMIDEGSIVKPGDELVKFDTTNLETKQTDQEQKRDNAKSALVAAQVSLENTTSQNESDIEQAELDVKFARMALEKYDAPEGQFQQDLQSAQGDVKLATTTLENARSKLGWSQKLFDKKYITESELKADTAAVEKAELDLAISKGKLELLKKYDYIEQKSKLESDLKQAESKLKRVKNKAQADLANATIGLATAQSSLARIERDLEQTIEDTKNAIITSPVAGRVVYAPQGNRWHREEPLSKGVEVRYNQEIIHIPEAGAMIATIKIDESQRDKVEVGMPVMLTGPNLPDSGLSGTLSSIAEYLDPSGWWNNNMKVYSAKVDIDPNEADLRTGMNCQTQIIVARYGNVLDVPVQAVTKIGEQHVVYMPTSSGLKPHPVEIGLDNGRKVHIISGLKEGDRVSLTPPLQPAARKDNQPPDTKGPDDTKSPRTTTGDSQGADNHKPSGGSARGNARLITRLVSMRQQGMLDKLELDDAVRQKLNDALDKAGAGEAINLDEDTLAAIRGAFAKLRAAAPKPDTDSNAAQPQGENSAHGQ